MQVEHLEDGGIRMTAEMPEWIKEKLDGMTEEQREEFEDRIKAEIQSNMVKALYSTTSKALEDAILGSWRMSHATDPFSEPPFFPEMLTYDGLGEYGKDWISLNDSPIINIKES